MKLIDFDTKESLTITNLRCKLLVGDFPKGDAGRIQHIDDDHYKLIVNNEVYDFAPADEDQKRELADKIVTSSYNLCHVNSIGNDFKEFFLHVAFFHKATHEESLNIVLSKKVKETLKKKNWGNASLSIEDRIRENFMLSDGTSTCYAFTSGKFQDYESDEGNDNEQQLLEIGETVEGFRSIRLYGQEFSMLVKLKKIDEEMFLSAESLRKNRNDAPPMSLRIGELTFKDGERMVSEAIKAELSSISGYLSVWDEYAEVEGDFLLKKARKIGQIKINRNHANSGEGGVIIYPEGISQEQRNVLSAGDYLAFSDTLPAYLVDMNMSWKDYKKILDLQKERKIKVDSVSKKILRIDKSGYWVIEGGEGSLLPKQQVITYSVIGDKMQIDRREAAREMIATGTSSFPGLGLVIEGKKSSASITADNVKKVEPLTAFVKEKIFSYEPRQAQIDAIDYALNTPDIAIIQGPPGTGKTTVITAIIERLNELADKKKDNHGQVLVTSFQHDAVRNIVERLRVNSLPTIKYGKQGDDDISQEKAIEDWCFEYAMKLKARNPEIQQTAEQKELERKYNTYICIPNDDNGLNFLRYAQNINTNNVIAEQIDFVIKEINLDEYVSSSKILDKVRRLRVTEDGFLDDGPEVADDLLEELEDVIKTGSQENDFIFDTLEEAADCIKNKVNDDLLSRLSKVKTLLLEKCSPRPMYKVESPRPEIQKIYLQIMASIHHPDNAEDEILYNLLNELENNTAEFEETVASYNFVYGATAQQSEGKAIKTAKNLKMWEHPEYDTVIIDEAARVNPGDLMVPMAQAKKRIILVGDHRQLPHMYDEEIFENMTANGSSVDKDIVKTSMFQYLKQKAEELYRQDGIKRTITLDAQYRMHPELGDFVNENFYKPYGEGFESPLPPEAFTQGIYDKPYMWVNVPNSVGDGEQEWDGHSRYRRAEASYIVEKIRDCILSEEGENLTYGVITFYSAQAKLIKDMLRGKDIEERVRVGTVDTFQGMERDVIFLSTVRSSASLPDINEELLTRDVSKLRDDDPEKKRVKNYIETVGMQHYGFLTSENRLCVSLSRQKKLLVVVGDARVFTEGKWGVLAEKCVPALKNFYEMCERGGAIIDA